ncbi:MAG: extracellular solute-binding protein, partial [Rhizobiaceae bacterium]|nr:extracellular solute-binding protein [Rhizobiaceae bacterium]
MKRFISRLLLAAASLAFSGAAHADDAPRDPSKVWEYLHSLPAEKRKAVIESEAKKDGSVVVYGATGLDRLQFFAAQFNKLYPDIKVDVVRLTEAEAPQRLLAEYRSGRPGADVVIFGPSAYTAFPDLIAPYESVEWNNFPDYLRFGSYDKGLAIVAYEIFPTAIAYRTDRGLTEDNTPKTRDDLADPKWKGRVGTLFSLEGVIGGLIKQQGTDKATGLLARLAANDNHLYSSHAALSDALAAGEIDIAWNLATHRTSALKKAGAPVGWHYQQPLIASANA